MNPMAPLAGKALGTIEYVNKEIEAATTTSAETT